MNVNNKILVYLESKGIGQTGLAKKMGISKQNLFRLLNSDDIKISQLLQITKVLEVPFTYFFDGKENVSNDEKEKDKKRIEDLEYLVNLNKRAELDKYIQVINEILKYEFKDEPQDIKNMVLGDFIESIKLFDESLNALALEVSQFSREMIKIGIEGRIAKIKREQTLLPRAKSIQKIRNEKNDTKLALEKQARRQGDDTVKELRELLKKDEQKKGKKPL